MLQARANLSYQHDVPVTTLTSVWLRTPAVSSVDRPRCAGAYEVFVVRSVDN